MSNTLYPKWKEALLQFSANNNLSSGAVKVALVSAAYTYAASDQFYSSISAHVVGTPQTVGSKTYTDGVFDGADVTFPSVSGPQAVALVLYVDTGAAATSPLVAIINTNVTNLPVTPDGSDIAVSWDAAGIFSL